jgi:hypothetical protein
MKGHDDTSEFWTKKQLQRLPKHPNFGPTIISELRQKENKNFLSET